VLLLLLLLLLLLGVEVRLGVGVRVSGRGSGIDFDVLRREASKRCRRSESDASQNRRSFDRKRKTCSCREFRSIEAGRDEGRRGDGVVGVRERREGDSVIGVGALDEVKGEERGEVVAERGGEGAGERRRGE
jgi:hypothetical protein